MESKNKEIINIPTGNPKLVEEAVNRLNGSYGADFTFLGSENRGEVIFALVDRGDSTIDQIFFLGFFHGAKITRLRIKGEIDY